MWPILKNEINAFFSSTVGFLIIGVFILFNGLVLFVFRGDFNVFDYGFADLTPFFRWLPWIFLLLIPAITMRSFSEELKTGTIELLKLKPISSWQLVAGKFAGAWLLVVLALAPSLIYVWCINGLTMANESADLGVITTSYLGLILVSATYTAIGTWTSSLTQNQVVAFILALALSWFLYAGFEGIGSLFSGATAQTLGSWGMKSHFTELTRGVIPLANVVYFLSLIAFFLFLTERTIQKPK